MLLPTPSWPLPVTLHTAIHLLRLFLPNRNVLMWSALWKSSSTSIIRQHFFRRARSWSKSVLLIDNTIVSNFDTQPGGHLFLSTIARTPLSYLLTIVAAEQILRKVSPGTHTYSKFVNPSELVSFFQKYRSPLPESSAPSPSDANTQTSSRPWIAQTHSILPTRTEAEIRGLVYVPWKARWELMSREASAYGAAECNYVFWVRKPYN